MEALRPDSSLEDAQSWLRRRLEAGARCPCCTQLAKVYRRKLNSGMAKSLIAMHLSGLEWCYVPDVVGSRSREEGKLRYWGLVEEGSERREDGGRAGYWKVTEFGRAFVLDEVTVPKYARIYDSRLLGFEGEHITIRQALGSRFSYDELMGLSCIV